jgi:hypothetical protein
MIEVAPARLEPKAAAVIGRRRAFAEAKRRALRRLARR